MTTTPTAPLSETTPARPPRKRRFRAVKEKMSSKAWQLTTLLTPILLTTWLTYWVWQKENDLESQLATQQLQLSEELFKSRFEAYDKLYVQLVHHQEKLRVAPEEGKVGDWNKTNADQAIQINELLNLSKLHMSPEVEKITDAAWPAVASADPNLLSDSIEDLRKQMKKEVDERMLAKQASLAPSTPSKKNQSQPATGGSQ